MLQVPIFSCNACQFWQRRYSEFYVYSRGKLLEKLVTHPNQKPCNNWFAYPHANDGHPRQE